MKRYIIILLICLLSGSLSAKNEARWLRYPSISPDGSTIIFGYMGNIYRVDANGGPAIAITTGNDYNMRPVWSHDGKTIAFASDKYGNFDIYTMPATGGIPLRLTFNSENDYPYDFTIDNKKVLFGSNREAPAKSVRFPGIRYFQNIYTIPANGGRPVLITAAGAENAHYNADGTKIIFQDKKGYEDAYRKHHTSHITRDIWVYNISENKYTKITSFQGEDRNPVYSSDDNSIYYINEKDSTLNLYKKSLSDNTEKEITHFKYFPVRNLSISNNNTLSFVWKGDIYTVRDGQTPKKLDIQVTNDTGYKTIKNIPVNKVSEFSVRPDGKEIAFVNRGEVFVTASDDSRTKRITNTPEQERMISWAPDGKTLVYSSEKNGSWSIYKITLKYPEEKYFYASTLLNTEPLVENSSDDFQPDYSPDGKKLAYINERNILKVLDLKKNKTITILPEGSNYSYSDGDWSFQWSPDSKWILADDQKGGMSNSNSALIKADGTGEICFPVNSGFGERDAKWSLDGKMMTYLCSRDGLKTLSQGEVEEDIFAVFFDQKAYDRYILSKEDLALLKEKESSDKKTQKDKDSEKNKEKNEKADKKEEKKNPLVINLKNIDSRKVKLTINSCRISDYVLSKDGSKVYYMASSEGKDYDLWETEPRTNETKILAKLKGTPSGIDLSKDEKTLFVRNGDKLAKVDAKSGEITYISINGEMKLNSYYERDYIFEHIWRQVTKKFYDPKIHGINWKMYHDEYAKFLPYINNNYDFQVLLSEMLGELNASHTGGRYFPKRENADQTASLGLLYDETYTGKGIKIGGIIPQGPLDYAKNKIKVGDIILQINEDTIKADENWNKYLNDISNSNTLLTVKSGKKTFNQTIRPVSFSTEKTLMYKRWTHIMAHIVDSLSKGQLGYVHIQGMDNNSFKHVYENVMGKNHNKKALIVDTRFNGGGWLHDDLNTFLSGKLYMKFAPQGHLLKGGESLNRWTKPSIVIISEGNYSDAFMFPFIYQQNHLGKLVGMPVAGTGTAVWWERQVDPTIVFGIPMVATIGLDKKITENEELEPDIKVSLPYNDFLNGKDPQIETAVKELMKEIK